MLFASYLDPGYVYYYLNIHPKLDAEKESDDPNSVGVIFGDSTMLEDKEGILTMQLRMEKERTTMLSKTMTIFTFQALLCVFLIWRTISDQVNDPCVVSIPEPGTAFARFITGFMMHITMNNELQSGLRKMKYAVNHHWKFSNWSIAFLAGLLEFTISLTVTIVLYFVIVLVPGTLDIVKDFLAVKVINDLDDYFTVEQEHKSEISKKIVDPNDGI